MKIQYNLFSASVHQDKKQGVMYETEARGMGIVLMRTFTGGVLQKWIPQAAQVSPRHPETEAD